MNPTLRNGGLVVELETLHRCLSSAVLGGGLGWVRTWLNLQVESGYDCADPETDLNVAAAGLREPVVGMLTAVPVARFSLASRGSARVVGTVGLGHPLAAAAPQQRGAPQMGTINLLAVVDVPLTDSGLVNAVQTVVEAKAQALSAARVPAQNADSLATGTATDSVCVACPAGGEIPFAGPATSHGSDLAQSAREAVLQGAIAG